MPITFETIHDTMTLVRAGKKEEIPFEIRTDPLTGMTARILNLPYQPPKSPNAEETFKRSEGIFCPFCPENIDTSTPGFPEELVPGGKIQIGSATVLPNVLPLDRYVGIAVFSPQHFVRMEELTPEMMRDAFLAVQQFIQRVSEVDRRAGCFSVNWNYMPPAGSSLVHPHLQVICGDHPMNHMRLQLEGANRYYRENGREFWDDFIREEKERASRLHRRDRPDLLVRRLCSNGSYPGRLVHLSRAEIANRTGGGNAELLPGGTFGNTELLPNPESLQL